MPTQMHTSSLHVRTNERSGEVEAFMAALVHRRKDEVVALRKLILECSKEITERIKWNAPSFCFKGDDRVTMLLRPRDRVELVFHRGAKPKGIDDFRFDDPSGLMAFKAPDRALVSLVDLGDLEAKRKQLSDLVIRWMEATSP